MKKQLNTSTMENELRQGSVFFQKSTRPSNVEKKQKSPSALPSPKEVSKTETSPIPSSESKTNKPPSPIQSINELTNQSTGLIDHSSRLSQSTETVNQTDPPIQSTQLAKPSISQSDGQLMGPVSSQPSAFYIPQAINKKIDEAVEYYQKNSHPKIDRSALVSAILGNPEIWEKAALDQLAPTVINQLKNRLSDRLNNRITKYSKLID